MLKFRPVKSLRKVQRGQSLVEFSLTAIIILLILSGLLDLGRLYFIYVALEDSAGEAVLYLSINPLCRTAADTDLSAGRDCSDPNNAEWRARNAVGGVLDWTNATVTPIAPPALMGAGATVRVRIEYPYRLLTPLLSQIANQINLTVEATQTVFNDPV
ncbi:MAG: hypothetical protein Kow0077_17480 [Anaerolineae bacterium]